MASNPKKSKAFYIKRGIIILLFSAAAIVLFEPFFLPTCGKKSNHVEAINNAKQIGLALYEFADKYDKYPSPAIAPEVAESNPDQPFDLTGNSSNAIFLQFFTSGMTESEQMFYARIKNSQKPDGNIAPGEALKKGEVGFSYISYISPKDNPKTPIVLTPLIPGTKKFDPKPFDGKAFVLLIDNSVIIYQIRKDGTIHDKDGNILSPDHPFWNGKAPTIHYPE